MKIYNCLKTLYKEHNYNVNELLKNKLSKKGDRKKKESSKKLNFLKIPLSSLFTQSHEEYG